MSSIVDGYFIESRYNFSGKPKRSILTVNRPHSIIFPQNQEYDKNFPEWAKKTFEDSVNHPLLKSKKMENRPFRIIHVDEDTKLNDIQTLGLDESNNFITTSVEPRCLTDFYINTYIYNRFLSFPEFPKRMKLSMILIIPKTDDFSKVNGIYYHERYALMKRPFRMLEKEFQKRLKGKG